MRTAIALATLVPMLAAAQDDSHARVREQWRMMRPMKEVIKEDVKNMIFNPEGHGARIDVDTLGDQEKKKTS